MIKGQTCSHSFFFNTHLNQTSLSPPEYTHTDKTHDICVSVRSVIHDTSNKSLSEEKGHEVKGQPQWAVLFSFYQCLFLFVCLFVINLATAVCVSHRFLGAFEEPKESLGLHKQFGKSSGIAKMKIKL